MSGGQEAWRTPRPDGLGRRQARGRAGCGPHIPAFVVQKRPSPQPNQPGPAASSVFPMGRSPRISEGKCALYGRDPNEPTHAMNEWRARLHNEHAGMPRADFSGANASLSLVWNPASEMNKTAQYDLESRKRASGLKMVQDFGSISPRSAAATSSKTVTGMWHAPSALQPPPALSARRPRGMEGATPSLPPSRDPATRFLDTETARLQASAHARSLGQTFLRAGNLTQAKAYLARAEQILQVDPKYVTGPAADSLLDEFKQMQKTGM